MKTTTTLLSAGAALALATAAAAAPATAKVSFTEPEKFTDVGISTHSESVSAEILCAQLKAHLEQLAAKRLPADQTLVVTIQDVDMAGMRMDPLRPRVVSDAQPPRIKLEWSLLDASGQKVAGGTEKLVNRTFMSDLPNFDRNETAYERALLTRWFEDTVLKHK